MRKIVIVFAMILCFASQALASNVSVNVNIGAPPPVYVAPPVTIASPPLFLQPPQLGFYVAVGVGYDLFLSGNVYYLHSGNAWYSSPYYNGPWGTVHYQKVPYGLRKHSIKNIHYYRDVHYKQYKAGKGTYKYKQYKPKYRKYSVDKHSQGSRGGSSYGDHGKYDRGGSYQKGGNYEKGGKNKSGGGGHGQGRR